jgi:hypothetical protein
MAANQVKVTLCVSYPDGYPDVLPNLSLQAEETNFNENDVQGLINDLRAVVCTPPTWNKKSRTLKRVCARGEKTLGWQ